MCLISKDAASLRLFFQTDSLVFVVNAYKNFDCFLFNILTYSQSKSKRHTYTYMYVKELMNGNIFMHMGIEMNLYTSGRREHVWLLILRKRCNMHE